MTLPVSKGFDRQDLFWLLVYSALVLALLFFHELGHDEGQAWGIGSSSSNPLNVEWHGRREGHTPFWHSILWLLSLIGGPVTMQVFAAACGILAAALLLRDRPFPRSICISILFGSFFLYEYTIVPRPYVLAFVLSAILASGIYNQNRSCIFSSFLCGLIAFTSAFGAVISAPLILMVLWDRFKLSADEQYFYRDLLISVLIYSLFFCLAVWTVVYPSEGRSFESAAMAGENASVSKIATTLITPVFPHYDRLPLGVGSWLSTSKLGSNLILISALISLFSVAVLVSVKRSALVAWVLAVFGIVIAVQIVGFLAERQVGQLYVVALCLIWSTRRLIYDSSREKVSHGSLKIFSSIVLTLVILYQVLIGLAVSSVDLTSDMTPWKHVSRHLDQLKDENTVLISDHVYEISALLAYQDSEAYDIRCDCWTRYGRWMRSDDPEKQLTAVDFDRKWCELEKAGKNVIAIVMHPTWWVPDERHEPTGSFAKGVRDGSFKGPKLFRLSELGLQRCKQAP